MTALVAAIREKRFRQVKLLLDIGVDVNGRDSTKRRTALMELCYVEEESKAARFAKLLLGKGARVGLKDSRGMTVLSYACRLGREQLVCLMIEEAHNFDLNSADDDGNTALHFAACSGNFAVLNLMIRALRKFKLTVDKPNRKGETALICASKSGNFFLARILVSEGKASKEARDLLAFKTADEWGKTKESIRSASKSPLFRVIQPHLLAHTADSPRESLTEQEQTRRPKTAPELTEKLKQDHRDDLRKVFNLFEAQVSSSYRPGIKPKLVIREMLSPTQSESTSLDSELADSVCELDSRASSPGSCLLSRRFSVGRAAAKLNASSKTFRRRSIATVSTATAGSKPGDLTRRSSQSFGSSGRRLSQSHPAAPKLRRGSLNVMNKIQFVGTKSKDSTEKKKSVSIVSRAPRFSQEQLMCRLQTLAEVTDSENEDDEENETPLQRSSPAQLFSQM